MNSSRFFALACTFVALSLPGWAADHSGTYKLTLTSQNGDTRDLTLKLKQQGEKIAGTVVSPEGNETEIQQGKVQSDGTISFVTRFERNGESVEMINKAKLEGDTLAGKTEFTNSAGEKREREWQAKRQAELSGAWKSVITRQDGTPMESALTLKQDGEKVTGTNTSRSGNESQLQDGKVQSGEVSFKILREREGRTITSRYRGKLQGNNIKGQVESDWTGEFRKLDWEAKRTGN